MFFEKALVETEDVSKLVPRGGLPPAAAPLGGAAVGEEVGVAVDGVKHVAHHGCVLI